MRAPLILTCLALAGLGATLVSPPLRDFAFLALAVLLASGLLLLRAMLRGARKARSGKRRRRSRSAAQSARTSAGFGLRRKARRGGADRPAEGRSSRPPVVVDGSNVMHWNGETPDIATLRDVIDALRARGYQPGVIFDANAGYKFGDRYLDDRHLARLLNLPGERVLVVPKGEPADPTILASARDLGAKILSNDRYRGWSADFPEVASPGYIVRGGYRQGRLWFDEKALLG